MRAVCADFEVDLSEFNGEANHVHLLVSFPPKALRRYIENQDMPAWRRGHEHGFTSAVNEEHCRVIGSGGRISQLESLSWGVWRVSNDW